MFNEDLSGYNKYQMTFVTPMVGNVRRTIFNQSELDLAKVACPHTSSS